MIETCLCIPLSYLMDTSLSRGGDKGFLFADHLTRGASVNQSPSKFENCFPKLTAVLLGQFIRSWGGSIYLSAIAGAAQIDRTDGSAPGCGCAEPAATAD